MLKALMMGKIADYANDWHRLSKYDYLFCIIMVVMLIIYVRRNVRLLDNNQYYQ